MAPSERRTQIIDAALRVFSRHGYHKATIKAIAQEAQLRSPALIYWYFPSKSALFRDVLRSLSPQLLQLVESDELLDAPPEEALARFARGYLAAFERPDMLRLFRLVVADALRQPEENTALIDSGLMSVILFLVRFFRHQIERGRLRPHDPQVSGRAFYAAINGYVMAHALFPASGVGLPPAEAYVDDVIRAFLDGLRGESNPPGEE